MKRLRPLTKTEKIFLIVLFLVGGFYFYLNKVYDPVMKAYEERSKELAALREEVGGLGPLPQTRSLERKIEKLKTEVEELEAGLEAEMARKKALTEAKVSKVITEVSRLAADFGMDVTKLEFKQVLPEGADSAGTPAEFDWQEYHLVLQGTGGNLAGFLDGLTKKNSIVLVENIELKPGGDDREFVITMKIYI